MQSYKAKENICLIYDAISTGGCLSWAGKSLIALPSVRSTEEGGGGGGMEEWRKKGMTVILGCSTEGGRKEEVEEGERGGKAEVEERERGGKEEVEEGERGGKEEEMDQAG